MHNTVQSTTYLCYVYVIELYPSVYVSTTITTVCIQIEFFASHYSSPGFGSRCLLACACSAQVANALIAVVKDSFANLFQMGVVGGWL